MTGRNVLVACAVLLLSAGVFVGLWRKSPQTSPRVATSEPRVSTRNDPQPERFAALNAARTSQLEARLEALEAAAKKPAGDVEVAHETDEPAQDLPIAPSAAEIQEQHVAGIQQHRAEPLDRQWSSTTSEALASDYAKKSSSATFSVKDIDCRSTSCAVEFEWPSRELAVAEWRQTLMQPTQVPCSRRIVIPDAVPGQTGPVRATLLADCSTWVAQGSPLAQQ